MTQSRWLNIFLLWVNIYLKRISSGKEGARPVVAAAFLTLLDPPSPSPQLLQLLFKEENWDMTKEQQNSGRPSWDACSSDRNRYFSASNSGRLTAINAFKTEDMCVPQRYTPNSHCRKMNFSFVTPALNFLSLVMIRKQPISYFF